MNETTELLIRKLALKDMELWIAQQIADIDTRLDELKKDNN